MDLATAAGYNESIDTRDLAAPHPLARLRAIARVRAELDELERQAVADARRPFHVAPDGSHSAASHTWAEIADALGVRRQTVHQKHRDEAVARGGSRARPGDRFAP